MMKGLKEVGWLVGWLAIAACSYNRCVGTSRSYLPAAGVKTTSCEESMNKAGVKLGNCDKNFLREF